MPTINPQKTKQTMNKITSNPQRKWEKKLRNATTDEQKKKAVIMLKIINPPKKENKKIYKESDEELFNAAQKYNKQLFKDKQEKEKKDKAEKNMSLKKDRLRIKINNEKKIKEEQDNENMENLKIEYSNQQTKEQDFLDNVQSHKSTMKVENTDKLDVIYDLIYKHTKKNKKKTKKLYNKFIHKEAMMIELAIQEYMKEHNVSYEEASHEFYLQMKEPKQRFPDPEPVSGPLHILDNYAKL